MSSPRSQRARIPPRTSRTSACMPRVAHRWPRSTKTSRAGSQRTCSTRSRPRSKRSRPACSESTSTRARQPAPSSRPPPDRRRSYVRALGGARTHARHRMTDAQPVPDAPRVPAVELRGMTKAYGDLVANDAIDLVLWPAEIHGVLGENGAGKTTLMRVLYGLNSPDSGAVLVNGEPVAIHSPADAISAGIGMVTQHFSLVGPMTVAENIVLGRTDSFRLDLEAARAKVREAAEKFHIVVDPAARVENLSVGEQQR